LQRAALKWSARIERFCFLGKTLNSLIQNKFPPFRNNCSNSGLIQPERNQAGSPASAQNYGEKREGDENEELRA
jgi:hypothetical protein